MRNGRKKTPRNRSAPAERYRQVTMPKPAPQALRSPFPVPHVSVSYGLPRTGVPSSASFRGWVNAALRGAKYRKPAELAIRVVDIAEGRALNRDYRAKDYATNVLSFPAELPPELKLPLLGDLAICAPVVLHEATEQGKQPRDHWAHMTIHGVLHLLGYDHIEDSEAETMEALETRILAVLGIADPYQP